MNKPRTPAFEVWSCAGATSFTCPVCDSVSHNPNDLANLYCGKCHKTVDEMRDEICAELLGLSFDSVSRRDCFSVALIAFVGRYHSIEGSRLVHGYVGDSFAQDRRIVHAWCELPAGNHAKYGYMSEFNLVADFTQLDPNSRMVSRDGLYQALGIRENELIRYTLAEALAAVRRVGHDGPWDFPTGNAPPAAT